MDNFRQPPKSNPETCQVFCLDIYTEYQAGLLQGVQHFYLTYNYYSSCKNAGNASYIVESIYSGAWFTF